MSSCNKILFTFIIIFAASQNKNWGQLPDCGLLYFDWSADINWIYSTTRIYNYNPDLPISSENPVLNTISTPSTYCIGLTVSPILGTDDETNTFYTIIGWYYWYYDFNNSEWVNTGHKIGGGGGNHIGAGGGFIFSFDVSMGNVYRYDGSGDAVFIQHIPDFSSYGPMDIIADCVGNFYILKAKMIDGERPYLRKYDFEGNLVKEWKVEGLSHSHIPYSFGIIGEYIYTDYILGELLSGVYDLKIIGAYLGDSIINFNMVSENLPQYGSAYSRIGDMGCCGESIILQPSVTISAPVISFCDESSSITIDANIFDFGRNADYEWYVNDVLALDSDIPHYTFIPQDGDEIYCIVRNDVCNNQLTRKSNTIDFNIHQSQYTVLDTSICSGSTFKFGSEIIKKPGTYLQRFQTSDVCDSIVEINVAFIEDVSCCFLNFSSAFSPNADGINDEFGGIGIATPKNFLFQIFNRWGQRVFISYSLEQKWDGRMPDGNFADVGTYYYTAKGHCYDGRELDFKGDVTLIR